MHNYIWPENNFKLESLFFPVDLFPLYRKKTRSQIDIFGNTEEFEQCGGYYALVDIDRDKVLTTVAKDYELVTNKEAIDLLEEIKENIFGESKEQEFSYRRIYLSEKRTECYADLYRELDESQPLFNDGWCAFIRMQNSYNRKKNLGYKIGFHNVYVGGSLMDTKNIIEASTSHSTTGLYSVKDIIRKKVRSNRYLISSIENELKRKIEKLKLIVIAGRDVLPFFCMIYNVKKTSDVYQKENLTSAAKFINKCVDEIIPKYGKNAYSLLLILSKYASMHRSALYLTPQYKEQALGKWADKFIDETDNPNFSINVYLKDYLDTASWLDSLI